MQGHVEALVLLLACDAILCMPWYQARTAIAWQSPAYMLGGGGQVLASCSSV